MSTLLYGSGCWHMTKHYSSRLASFHTTNLRNIKRIWENNQNARNLKPKFLIKKSVALIYYYYYYYK